MSSKRVSNDLYVFRDSAIGELVTIPTTFDIEMSRE